MDDVDIDYKIKYRLNGNMQYIEEGAIVTDGFTTGYILDTEKVGFDLWQFIAERENGTYALELDDMNRLNDAMNKFSDEIEEFNDLCDSLYLPNSLTNKMKYKIYAN